MAVEPFGDAMTLGSHDEPTVASSRADDDCSAIGLDRSMKMDPGSFLGLAGNLIPEGYLVRNGRWGGVGPKVG
jgi:hypothetical protein